MQTLLDQMASAGGTPLEELNVEEARALLSAFASLGGRGPEMAEERDLLAPGPDGDIPVRLYTPRASADTGGAPVLVWFHGGGWVLGSIDDADGICRTLAEASGAVVASVGYRLAPEHRFPAAPRDCYAALAWLSGHPGEIDADTSRMAIGGDSAGANLAAVSAVRARDAGGPSLRFQLLVYPPADATTRHRSMTENGEGYFLTAGAMDWFWDHYLGDRSRGADPMASPLLADHHRDLPPALVVTAEFDPLRDEGEAYADALRRGGVETSTLRYDGMIHGFFTSVALFDAAREAVSDAAERLRKALAPSS